MKYLFVPGINNDMGSVNGWQDRMCRQVEKEELGYGNCFNYHVGPLDQGVWWQKHITQIRDIMDGWLNSDDQVAAVGHSHGCGLLLDFLKGYPNFGFNKLFLIAPAAPADCWDNGLNKAVDDGQLMSGTIYTSWNDEALQVAPVVGMGQLGLVGPQNQTPLCRSVVLEDRDDSRGHSTILNVDNWMDTFRKITCTTG